MFCIKYKLYCQGFVSTFEMQEKIFIITVDERIMDKILANMKHFNEKTKVESNELTYDVLSFKIVLCFVWKE